MNKGEVQKLSCGGRYDLCATNRIFRHGPMFRQLEDEFKKFNH